MTVRFLYQKKKLQLSAESELVFYHCHNLNVVAVQSLSHIRLLATPCTAARQASPSGTISQSLLKLTSIESAMPSNHLILCRPFSSCPQSFPASESFPMSQLFSSGGQSTGASASASVIPMNSKVDFLWD